MKAPAKKQKKVVIRGVKIPPQKRMPLPQRPARPPVPLPKIILHQLQALSSGLLMVSWMHGALWLVIAISTALLLQGSLDWLLDLSWGARLFFFILDLAAIGWLAWWYLIRATIKKLTPEQAALKAEIKFPALRTSLISAVQLAKSPEGSPAMVEALIRQVAERAKTLKFQKAVSTIHLRKYFIAAAVLGVAVAGLYIKCAPKSNILLRRILLSHEPLPTQTIVVAVSGDFSIPAGETIEVEAQAQGVIPRNGRVEITYKGQASQMVSITPKVSSPDTFSLTLPNIQQPLTYRFYLNDGRGEEYKVTLFHEPIIESITFEQNYPAYTGLAKTQHNAGNLTLLAGSKLHIEAKTDQQLKSAHVVYKGVDQQAVDMTVGADGKSISCDLPVLAKGFDGFSIVTTNMEGFDSKANTVYRVEVVPDNPPEIAFAEGSADSATLVEEQRPRMRFQVRDDFMVTKVFLCCQTAGADAAGSDENATEAQKLNVTKIPIEVPKAAPSLAFDYEWKNPQESGLWKAGTTITWWIEAVDNNDVTGPGVGQSPKHTWSIVTLEEKRKELTEKLKQQADEIEHLSEQQQELKNNSADLIEQKK